MLFDGDITLHSLDVNFNDDNLIKRHSLEAFADGNEMILLAGIFAVAENTAD